MNSTAPCQPSRGRPPAGQSGSRREAILASAVQLFAGQGVAGTTIAQIAEAAGVTPAMVHYYFKSREGLLDAVAEESILPVAKQIWAGADGQHDPLEAILALVGRLLEAIASRPWLPQLWAREILAGHGALRDRVVPSMVPLERHKRLLEAIATAQREGRMNQNINPALLLPTVFAMVMAPLAGQALLERIPTIQGVDRKDLGRHVEALLRQALRPLG